MKQWDSCVFGSQIRATTNDVFSALRRHSSAQNQHISDNKSFTKNGAAASMSQKLKFSNVRDGENINLNGVPELQSKKHAVDCHPEQKVLLLCGPPGLGKTTLAHVAAKHCGYRVVEINASDERSSTSVESKILDVVQMNSVMADSKPKCLVIDEIDGALGEGKGAVEVILKMVAADKKSFVEKENSSKEAQAGNAPLKRAKKRNTSSLLRPVICICNDLYAPALRSLRQIVKVHIFVQPTISRVVHRLKYICKQEGFKTSSIALSALAEFAECDIRSCLNTLQFLKKKKETLNFMEVGSQVVGQKDMSRSAFDVWKEIFQKRKSKKGRNVVISDSSDHGDFNFLYSLISNRGEYELTMDGIHENFLRLSYNDPMMQKTVRCLDTLGVSDSLLKYILRTQHMSLYVYQPPIVIITRNLIAQFEKPNIEWPKSSQKCRAMLRERTDSIRIWHNKISPPLARHLSIEYFVEDLISPLLHILSPPNLRPAALHLLTDKEKNDLAQLVDTMVSYSIKYGISKQEPVQKIHKYRAGAVSDVSELSFDPPIDEFVKFQDYQSEHIGLSSAMKQVLVHEVEKQRILRESIGKPTNYTEESNFRNQASPCSNTIQASDLSMSTAAEHNSQLKMTHTTGQNVASKSSNSFPDTNRSFLANGASSKAREGVKKPIRSSCSFFDRFRQGSSKDPKSSRENLQKEATNERDSRPLFFKYNEGFTNAVKRPVKMRELLL